MATNKNPRGSEWRKWDLHVHTPASIEHNYRCKNGKDVWDSFISDLEALPKEIKVLGINDYLFIDGYKKVLSYKKEGRLANIDLILPVIELRLAKFCGTKQFKRINFHIIFSNDIAPEVIENQFINALSSSYQLDPESGQTTWDGFLTKDNLKRLGEKIINSVPEEQKSKFGSPMKEGFNNLNLELDAIYTTLEKASSFFKGKYITAIGKTEWDELKWDDSSIAEKKNIINRANIVFTAAESVEKFNSAKLKLKEQCVNDLLLDCSDAHNNIECSSIKDRLGNCFTWIKADPTFEGLKQVMYEPEERVRIQTTIPDDKNIYQVLDKVVLNEEGFWNDTIYLSPNLNTIIGGRSTGKSTLLKAIAAVHNHNSVDSDDFIMKHLGGITVEWKDGTDQIGREIEYFKQSYMHDIASDPKKTSELIESIIKNKDTSGILTMYYTHLNDVSRKITEQMFSLFQTFKELNEKRKELTALGKKDGVVQQINILKNKVSELQNTSKITLEQQALFDANIQKIKSLELEIEKADKDLKILEKLLIVTPFDYSFEEQWQMDKLSFRLNQYDLSREFKNLKIRTEQDFIALVRKYQEETILAKGKIQEQCRVIRESEAFTKVIKFIEGNKELKDISDRITAEEKKLAQIEQLQATIDKIRTDCNNLFASIIDLHCSIKGKAEDVEKQLNISYDGLSITVKLEHHRDILQHFLEDRLNLRGNERQDYYIRIVRNYDSDNRTYAKDFLKKILLGELQLKNGYEALNVATEFFAKSWYSIGFELSYQGDSFKQMSEGKQAFVILKLLLDFSEKTCPILIDQPEDSLDNRAIYNELVTYIKRKKRERQIILVTHNSNVVVSADAENVIVANQEGSDSHNKDGLRFQYVNGALEYTKPKDKDETSVLYSQGIREHVCDILEGGVEAFKKREQKYGI